MIFPVARRPERRRGTSRQRPGDAENAGAPPHHTKRRVRPAWTFPGGLGFFPPPEACFFEAEPGSRTVGVSQAPLAAAAATETALTCAQRCGACASRLLPAQPQQETRDPAPWPLRALAPPRRGRQGSDQGSQPTSPRAISRGTQPPSPGAQVAALTEPASRPDFSDPEHKQPRVP